MVGSVVPDEPMVGTGSVGVTGAPPPGSAWVVGAEDPLGTVETPPDVSLPVVDGAPDDVDPAVVGGVGEVGVAVAPVDGAGVVDPVVEGIGAAGPVDGRREPVALVSGPVDEPDVPLVDEDPGVGSPDADVPLPEAALAVVSD